MFYLIHILTWKLLYHLLLLLVLLLGHIKGHLIDRHLMLEVSWMHGHLHLRGYLLYLLEMLHLCYLSWILHHGVLHLHLHHHWQAGIGHGVKWYRPACEGGVMYEIAIVSPNAASYGMEVMARLGFVVLYHHFVLLHEYVLVGINLGSDRERWDLSLILLS